MDATNDLIRLSQEMGLTEQRHLIHIENDFARKFKYNVFPDEEPDHALRHYLLMTSLPFVFGKDVNFPLQRLWQKCSICKHSGPHIMEDRLFFPTGNLRPKYMVIGDAPAHKGGYGDEFDQDQDIGRLWVGKPTSHLLRRALDQLDIHHLTWYTNLVKHSIVGNAPSTGEDRAFCSLHMMNEMICLKPDIVITLGNHVRDSNEFGGYSFESIPIFHPSYAVRCGWSVNNYVEHIMQRFDRAGLPFS